MLVGQPFETIKTLRQVQSSSSAITAAKGSKSIFQTASNLYSTAGIRGFYRGGVPLLLGGGLMVSWQDNTCLIIIPLFRPVMLCYTHKNLFRDLHNSVYAIQFSQC